jgi:hypothetical protein
MVHSWEGDGRGKESEVRGTRYWCERWSCPDSPPPFRLVSCYGLVSGRRLQHILFGRLLGSSSSAGCASDPASRRRWGTSTVRWCCKRQLHRPGQDPQEARQAHEGPAWAPCHRGRFAAALLHHRAQPGRRRRLPQQEGGGCAG